MTFNFGSAKVCSPAIFETCFSYDKDMGCCRWLVYVFLHNCSISIDSYSPDNKFYSFIIIIILINAVISLLNCLVLILYLYKHFPSLRSYFIYLNIIWTFILLTVLWKYPDVCTVSPHLYLCYYLMVLKTISPDCGGMGISDASFFFFFFFFFWVPYNSHKKWEIFGMKP